MTPIVSVMLIPNSTTEWTPEYESYRTGAPPIILLLYTSNIYLTASEQYTFQCEVDSYYNLVYHHRNLKIQRARHKEK